jgi:carbamoylphosphate synthase large subunit/REP element-mobilizing transposase RayT
MPRDNSIHKILVIGSGPIVIGQGCEFDYSGVQACKALKEEGYTVILVNSNPATIMTDPEFAHRTYIEPITPEVVEKIVAAERPDALLPTLGGQTALNCSMKLHEMGVLEKYGVRMIGAKPEAIHKGEDRLAFKNAMLKIGLDMPKSGVAHTMEEGRAVAAEIGTMPLIIRPAFTLGGTGGGIAYNREEFETIVARGLDMSPVSEVLIEESLLGWKEFEMEVMRDHADNCVIICSIENVDPMGVHTGDSITVAPIQTLTDREFQVMRDASFAIIREIGVETGGSNIQFAVHPDTGRMIVIEMNPRVSRSSALASKATGFPIAKIAAKLAVGYTLDEVRNDITRETPASFEPTIDYVVVKCPRFTFEKFPQADAVLTTQMKSVGEAMAIGRTFKEALQKALRSLEIKRFGLIGDGKDAVVDDETLRTRLIVPGAERIFFLGLAFQRGWTVDEVFELTKIDRWFLENIREIVEASAAFGTQASLPVRPAGFQPAERDAAGRMPAVRTGLKPVFQPFREHAEVQIQRRNLPHWEQPGATYFITFRLADSVPSPLLAQWTQEFESWSQHHPKPWDSKTAYEYLTRFVEPREHWLDQGHGSCALRDPRTAEIVASALRHFDGERYHLDAFVVMPNHVHVLVMPTAGHSLSDILHSWKSFTANQVNKLVGSTGKFWMEESVDRIVRDWDSLVEYRDYIAANPEKAKLGAGEFVLSTEQVIGNTGCQPVRPPGFQPGGDAADAAEAAGWQPAGRTGRDACVPALRRAKKFGFSDRQLAIASGTTDGDIRAQRKAAGIIPTYRLVDTCAAEFEAYTPYYYSTYGDENERRESGKKKVIILGGGPNRIGQGIEFDYCCVHASFALREMGFETIMVNSNPETVSTDYDTSDKLYFEPLTLEDVLNICEQESENLLGVIVQFGGQTPLNLANGLAEAGVPIIGTSPRSIEIAEDRKLFGAMLDKLGIRQTSGGTAVTEDEAVAVANRVTYPVLVRPSFVLGGRGMMLVHNETDLRKYVRDAIDVSVGTQASQPVRLAGFQPAGEGSAGSKPADRTGKEARVPEHPILVDHFLEDATEVDVDCICDGEIAVIGAIMEHIEQAGIHSGDSACVIPPFSLSEKVKAEIATATKAMARELNVIGLMNVQFAVQNETVYVLEVNPRASRTAPFVSKAIGVPLPKLAAKIMAGAKLKDLGFTKEVVPAHYCVKEAVFPFTKFPGTDIVLGPEMKSTGEVMGIDANLGIAYAKAQMAAQPALPLKGNIFISVADADKTRAAEIADGFAKLGFTLYATSGTAAVLEKAGVPVVKIFKLSEGRPNALDMLKNGELAMIINTPSGKAAREDEIKIRSTASSSRVPVMTTLRAARASLEGIRSMKASGYSVKPLQEWHKVS